MGRFSFADHCDTFTKKVGANRRTLCGHGDANDTVPGAKPFDPSGAVSGKVMDSKMAESMHFIARAGHPCGIKFDSTKFLADHPEYSWQSPVLRDMEAGPWTEFRTSEHIAQPAQ